MTVGRMLQCTRENERFPNSTLEKVFRDQTVFGRSGQAIPLHSNISATEANLLYDSVRAAAPRTSVEVGFAQGISTIAILQALHDNGLGTHHVIDPFQASFENAGLEMVNRAGLNRWMIFHERFPEEVIPAFPELSFAFIDGSHLFDLTLVEFVLIDKKLASGGLIGFHDLWMPSIQALLRYILTNRAYRISNLSNDRSRSGTQSWRSRIKGKLRAALAKVPQAARYFSGRLLDRERLAGLPNLVLLEKMGPDKRPWTFHEPF